MQAQRHPHDLRGRLALALAPPARLPRLDSVLPFSYFELRISNFPLFYAPMYFAYAVLASGTFLVPLMIARLSGKTVISSPVPSSPPGALNFSRNLFALTLLMPPVAFRR